MTIRSMVGEKFGRLTVAGFNSIRSKRYYWDCRCDCGAHLSVDAGHLRSGHTTSCGCALVDFIRATKTTHGQYVNGKPSSELTAWKSMLSRCFDSKNKSYKNYGGRGISVCERWRDSFEAFFADMGVRPSAKHSIDRKEVNGSYSPDNCRWATPQEQARNRRDAVLVEVDGRKLPLKDVCEARGLPYNTVWQRMHKLGWSAERSISQKVGAQT